MNKETLQLKSRDTGGFEDVYTNTSKHSEERGGPLTRKHEKGKDGDMEMRTESERDVSGGRGVFATVVVAVSVVFLLVVVILFIVTILFPTFLWLIYLPLQTNHNIFETCLNCVCRLGCPLCRFVTLLPTVVSQAPCGSGVFEDSTHSAPRTSYASRSPGSSRRGHTCS